MLEESAPSTVVYRKKGNRTSLRHLIDSMATNGQQADDEGDGGVEGTDPHPTVSKREPEKAPQKLSWIQGVFIPCLLNIWGVIMFLRLGWVVGEAGIVQACLIVTCSKVVTSITALSLCAITTNGEVKGGGVYFLISRALGPVFGGTIGILFFIAQAVATSLYVIGFAESVVSLMDEPFTGSIDNDIRVIGIGTSVLLLAVALVGVGWYAKCQVGLLVILVVAMLAVFIGAFLPSIPDLAENAAAGFVGFWESNWEGVYIIDPSLPSVEQNFFTVFSVFFPAATGVMAGANLSGDLKDPSMAIPKGTLLAILVTYLSYLGLVFVVGGASLNCEDPENPQFCEYAEDPDLWATLVKNKTITVDNQPTGGLIFNNVIMKNLAIWAPLFYVGVFAATLSSALASLVGAPRILQSVASDKLFPWAWFNYFGVGRGRENEPVRAYILTFFICCGCVAIAQLDVIAPLISNFFMLSYAFTNYACFASSYAKYPGWRPSFKYYNKWLSLFGFVLCIVVMFLMDYITTLITLVLGSLLYVYLWQLDPNVDWGPAGTARLYFSTLQGLERLQSINTDHVKTYRPQFLVMSGPPQYRTKLIKFASLLSKGGGITICGDVILSSEISDEHTESSVGRVVDVGGRVRLEGIREEEGEEDGMLESHNELAVKLAARLAAVNQRRKAGDEFLASKRIWTKRCPHAFYECVVGDTLLQGFESLLETAGLGKMRSNVVILGFKSDWQTVDVSKVKDWESMVRISLASDLGLVILRDDLNRFDLDVTVKRRFNSVASAVEYGGPTEAPEPNSGEDDSDSTIATDAQKDAQVSAGPVSTSEILVRGSDAGSPIVSPSLQGEYVDVWWIADDGGLTILLPFLLRDHRLLRGNKKLRVFTITNYNTEETSRLQKTEMRMIHLLQKLRIEAQVIGVEANLASAPGEAVVKEFEELGTVSLDALTKEEKIKTNRVLRLTEVLRQHTDEKSATVFMTLPLPDTGMPVKLFTSWLHIMSTPVNNIPMVFIRGSGEKVVTFVC